MLWTFSPARSRLAAGAAGIASLGLLAAASPALADVGAGVEDLERDIETILDAPALEGAVSGVVVRSLTEGDELYSAESGTDLIPASNAKLFTSAAVLRPAILCRCRSSATPARPWLSFPETWSAPGSWPAESHLEDQSRN